MALRAVHISLLLSLVSGTVADTPPPCKPIEQIYSGGKELCENMWNGAFKYEADEPKGYTMWFFDKQNPNNDVARSLGKLAGASHDVCHLDYYHKDVPGPEPESFTECHPWKESSCCAHGTVETAQKLKEGYGSEYHWDRCGPLSPECERFFVQEACFYECDPNAGLYRKHPKATYDARCDAYSAQYDKAHADKEGCDHNAWQMSNMPIKASYCDAWWTACRKDLFCAADGGDYFSCANIYKAIDLAAADAKLLAENKQLKKRLDEDDEGDDFGGMGLPIIAILAAAALLACGASAFLIAREKSGKPVFAKLLDGQQPPGSGGAVIGNQS